VLSFPDLLLTFSTFLCSVHCRSWMHVVCCGYASRRIVFYSPVVDFHSAATSSPFRRWVDIKGLAYRKLLRTGLELSVE